MAMSLEKRRFVDAYLGSAKGNATRAAIAAGAPKAGARTAGYRWLKDADIREEIDRALRGAAMGRDATLHALTRIAEADLSDCIRYDPKSRRAEFDYAKARDTGLLSVAEEVSFGEGGTVKFRLPSRLQAIALLCKYHGLTVDRHEVTVRGGEPSGAEVRERLLEKLATPSEN